MDEQSGLRGGVEGIKEYDMLGWIGNVFIVVGLWKIGNRVRAAFLFSIVGESAWTANALLREAPDYALAFICCVFNIMAMRAWWKWGQAT